MSNTNLEKRAKMLIDSHQQYLDEVSHSIADPDSSLDRTLREVVVREKELSYIVDSLSDEGNCPDWIQNGYADVCRMNTEFEGSHSDYNDYLNEELKDLIDFYPTIVCYVFELEPFEIEVDNDLCKRDSIEILMDTLPQDYISEEMITTVKVLDDVLKCRFEMYEDSYMELKKTLCRDHYPSKFWWRHPDQIFGQD